MKDLRRSLLLHLWLQLLLWIGVIIVANHASSAFFARVDLTEDQRYTLSQVGRGIMGELEKPLVTRVYFTHELEAPFNNHEQAVREKLEELRAWSGGKMELQFIDPTGDRVAVEEAQRFGIQPLPYKFQSKDRLEVKKVFMGVSFVYGDRQATADMLTSIDTLEYELLRAILAVTEPPEDRQTIGFLQGNGEPDLGRFAGTNPLGQLRDRLGQSYDLMNVTLGGDEGVPEQVDAMVVIGPQQSVPDRAQYQLDQFIMNGGSALWFVASTKPDFRTMRAEEVRHDLNALLGHYGVVLSKATLVDRENNEKMPLPVQIGMRRTTISLPYPLLPTTTGINRQSRVVRLIDRAVLPFASPVSLAEEMPQGVEGQVWIETMPTCNAANGLVHIGHDAFQAPPFGEDAGPHPAAVAVSGRFSSFFADRDIPPPAGQDKAPDDPLSKIVDGEPSRMVVVGSADFVANNLPFVQNSLDWLLEDDALIDVRSRQANLDLLEAPAPGKVLAWKAGILGIPLLLLFLLALTTWILSRRRSS